MQIRVWTWQGYGSYLTREPTPPPNSHTCPETPQLPSLQPTLRCRLLDSGGRDSGLRSLLPGGCFWRLRAKGNVTRAFCHLLAVEQVVVTHACRQTPRGAE